MKIVTSITAIPTAYTGQTPDAPFPAIRASHAASIFSHIGDRPSCLVKCGVTSGFDCISIYIHLQIHMHVVCIQKINGDYKLLVINIDLINFLKEYSVLGIVV